MKGQHFYTESYFNFTKFYKTDFGFCNGNDWRTQITKKNCSAKNIFPNTCCPLCYFKSAIIFDNFNRAIKGASLLSAL